MLFIFLKNLFFPITTILSTFSVDVSHLFDKKYAKIMISSRRNKEIDKIMPKNIIFL